MEPASTNPKAVPSIQEILLSNAQLIKQGAEARIYVTELFPSSDDNGNIVKKGEKVLLKHRFKKAYRHPSLDAVLTARRITHEARILVRARRAGVLVPSLRFVDLQSGIIGMTYIEGMTAREAIIKDSDTDDVSNLLRDIGTVVGLLHSVDLVHGDLTTSNLILRSDGKVVLIDFGLSTTSTLAEDKAVDLYVLERAFGSTHPALENRFSEILGAYATEYKSAKAVLSRLDEVRLRGRKRSMVG